MAPRHRPSAHSYDAPFVLAAIGALAATSLFLAWIASDLGGPRIADGFDDIGEFVAALLAAGGCSVAAMRSRTARTSWGLVAAACFAWAAGEVAWSYYDLADGVQVPFPSLADVGFLTAVPLLFAGLLLFPGFPARAVHRARALLDGSIVAASVLFASWAMLLHPIYRAHQGSVLAQSISLAYPLSDLVMLSLVIILVGRSRQRQRLSVGLVMAGVIAMAVSDSAFAYFTEVRNYQTSLFDTGWVAGFLLIGLGALRSMPHRSPAPVQTVDDSSATLVAPYVPVLVVLAVSSIQLLRGSHLDPVSWVMAFALCVLVLARESTRFWTRPSRTRANKPRHGPRTVGRAVPAWPSERP